MAAFKTIRISDPRFEQDGLRHVTVKSPSLRGRGDITLFVPTVPPSATSIPIVLLLHGVYSSHWAWAMVGGAHRTAQRLIAQGHIDPLILAMPSDGLWGDGSGYLTHQTYDFERWIVDEVPHALIETISCADAQSPLFIAGLSMGGFGALRLGANYPRRFRGISAHSAITRLEEFARFMEEDLPAHLRDERALQPLDLILANSAHLPPLRFDCGTEDPLLASNRALHQQLEQAGIPHLYEEFPGGHAWAYWEAHLADTLRFFQAILHQSAASDP